MVRVGWNWSIWFLEEERKTDPSFLIDEKKTDLSIQEREIRWHQTIKKLVNHLVEENQVFRDKIGDLEEAKKEFDAAKTDLIYQKGIMVDEIEMVSRTNDKTIQVISKYRTKANERFEQLEDRLESIEKNNEEPRHQNSRGRLPQIKIMPPSFGDLILIN